MIRLVCDSIGEFWCSSSTFSVRCTGDIRRGIGGAPRSTFDPSQCHPHTFVIALVDQNRVHIGRPSGTAPRSNSFDCLHVRADCTKVCKAYTRYQETFRVLVNAPDPKAPSEASNLVVLVARKSGDVFHEICLRSLSCSLRRQGQANPCLLGPQKSRSRFLVLRS